MSPHYFHVMELMPGEDGEDKERFVWRFDIKEDAVALIRFIESRDVHVPCLKIKELVCD